MSDGQLDFTLFRSVKLVSLVMTFVLTFSMLVPATIIGADSSERDYYFVQFGECPTRAMLDDIIAGGGVIHQYHHTYRFLVDLETGAKDSVLALPYVSSIEVYGPEDKLGDGLAGLTGRTELRVDLHDNVDPRPVVDRFTGLGAEIVQVNTGKVNYIKCKVDPKYIDTIASIKEVCWIQPENEPQTLLDNIQTPQYQGQDVPQTAFPPFGGDGVLTEVQDNGCQLTHPELTNIVWTDGAVITASHGTCVSGIMFSTGVDPTAQGMQYQGIGAYAQWNTGNYLTIQNLATGNFNEGTSSIPGVAQTNSWWSGDPLDGQYDALSNELDDAANDYPHVLIHWACGNSNSGESEGLLIAESMSKNCISGGAIFHLDSADMSDDNWHSAGSGSTPSRGPAADGRVKPDLCGPFDWIRTADSGSGYTNTFGGTSGATPTIAGSSGLAYDMYQANYFGNNQLHAWPYSCTIKALMIADAQQYPIDNSGVGSRITRNVQGWGTPDMENMYNLGETYHVIEEYPQPLSAGSSWSRTVTVDGTKPLKVTLCWIDPSAPSSTGNGRSLLNNLDLRVTSPLSTVYYGNVGLDNDTWSIGGMGDNRWSIPSYGGHRDDVNNVENVFIQNPFPGVWTIEVLGRSGDMQPGFQDFSVVASGAMDGEPPEVMVVQPNGGEVWNEGDFHDIIWTMSDLEDPTADLRVTIDYSTDGGATYPYNIITDQTGFTSPATYNWQVPNTPTTNARVRVTVQDVLGLSSSDVSNNTFTISADPPVVDVTYPNGGESFMGGGSATITWTASAGSNPLLPNPITIDYSTNGPGGPWTPLAVNEPNDGEWLWDPIPPFDVANCYVRVGAEDTMGFVGIDASDGPFEIDSTAPQPALDPYAEISGTHVMIYWTQSSSADIDHYKVYWSMNNWDATGASYSSFIDTGGPAGSAQHSNVGTLNPNSYYYQIRAYDEVGHETVTTSRQAAKFGSTQSTFTNPSGWFMLGSSLIQSDTSLAHVIQGQGLPGNMDCIRTYDPLTNTWPTTIPGAPAPINTVTDLDEETGFWMHITTSTRFATAGYIADNSIQMQAGWNLVPYPFAQRFMNAAGIDAHLTANCPDYAGMLIADYSQPYHITTPSGSENIFHNQAIWVRVTADTTWTVINY